MDHGRLVQNLRFQANACADLSSPFYAALLEALAGDVAAGGVTAQVLAGYEDAPGPAAVGLRLLGTVHRLVLAGRAPALAPFYPSVGGTADAAGAVPAFLALLEGESDAVREGLTRAPQTNEVGRAAALAGGLLHVAAATRLPVRLHEIGASGGLNLRADRFRYEDGDARGWGPGDSPVRLASAWRGALPPLDAPLTVAERRGCDLDPVDATTEAGRLTLTSYVWPDDASRLARLRGALDVARQVPATVVRAGAGDFLADAEVRAGTTLVVWHSVMWQYLDEGERTAVQAHLDRLAVSATPDRPLAHLSFEPRRGADGAWRFVVALTLWPGGEERVLGEALPHGVPVTWAS